MHRLRRFPAIPSIGAAIVTFLLLSLFAGCGGSKPPGPSPVPGKITLIPASATSVQLGSAFIFTASAQNATGANISATFTYQSSDTSILNLAPNGVACAGLWDAAFVNCTPGNYGVVQVTASAFGATSLPTLVYVHPPIDNIQISLVTPVTQPPPACPGQQRIPLACAPPLSSSTTPACVATKTCCLSANQTMTLQANAFSKGLDITSSVGPFTWNETSTSVVTVTPVATNTNTNIPTNQVTVTPNTPGFTPVYATSSDVSSQPYYAETCPVQCVALELDDIGSGQTSFSVDKSTSETAVATAVDVQGCVVPKPTLTWSSSQPGAVLAGTAGTGCAAGTNCAVTTPAPGAGSITAACTPPTCNIGFPQSVAGLPQTLIQPMPVYPVTAISGHVSGAAVASDVLATSLDCATNLYCNDNTYYVSTSTNQSGAPTSFPAPPNSLLLDPAGDKAYAGGDYEVFAINPANFASTTSPFSALGSFTGKVLATSANGDSAVFSDTVHTPNQVYVVNSTAATAVTTLNISGATLAAFSPDGLKAFILGTVASTNTLTLYVYSPLQALQTYPIATGANATAIAFSSNGAFAYIAGNLPTPEIAVYDTCDNQPATDGMGHVQVISVPTAPLFMQILPDATHIIALDSTGFDSITATSTGPVFPTQCPGFVSNSAATRINLAQGTITPINFFMSPDASTAYIAASDLSNILAYNFVSNSTSGIPLVSATGTPVSPVTASMTVDGTLIYVAGSDGQLHEVSTTAGMDLMQIAFPNLTDVNNPFCSSGGATVPCNLNFVAVKP
jgi:hypothetical protein